jgi:hypothetical protein
MRIDALGNVGIGTSSPTNVSGYTTLNVGAGSIGSIIKIDGANSGHYHRILNNNGQLYIQADQGNTTGSSAIVFGVDATERMRIDSSGNVGIGTTAPREKIHLHGGTSSTQLLMTGGGLNSEIYGGFIEGDGVSGQGGHLRLGVLDAGTERVGIEIEEQGNQITFDTAGTEAMRIDSSGTIKSSMSGTAANLVLESSANTPYMSFTESGAAQFFIGESSIVGGGGGYDIYATSGQGITFFTNALRRVDIDTSGNLLVGTTDTTLYNNTTGGGAMLSNSGCGFAKETSGAGDPVAYFNNTGDDGQILDFRKDGSTVGSIGTSNGRLTIGDASVGVRFADDLNTIIPWNVSTNAARDAGIDLGNGSVRFKDLYLSGTANTGRIKADDGSLGNTGITDCDVQIIRNGTSNLGLRTVSNGEVIRFVHTSTDVGSIDITTSATSYNTSSDYRLKENVVAMSGATERLKQLAPKRFNFIADADTTVDGFLAHEVQAVVPEAITGAKDAMRDEEYEVTPAVLDDDGNVVTEAVMGTRSVPDYQGIDQSKLVPLLVATIQELEARIAALESN